MYGSESEEEKAVKDKSMIISGKMEWQKQGLWKKAGWGHRAIWCSEERIGSGARRPELKASSDDYYLCDHGQVA